MEQLRAPFDTDLIGNAVLTDAMIPLLRKSSDARVISLTPGQGLLTLAWNADRPCYGIDYLVCRSNQAALNMLMIQWTKTRWYQAMVCLPGILMTNHLGDPEVAKIPCARDASTGAVVDQDMIEGQGDDKVGQVVDDEVVGPLWGPIWGSAKSAEH